MISFTVRLVRCLEKPALIGFVHVAMRFNFENCYKQFFADAEAEQETGVIGRLSFIFAEQAKSLETLLL